MPPGWHTLAAVEQSHQWHRDLTRSEDQVEMQLKPAFQWTNEQQAPCKIAIIQLQGGGGGDHERMVRNVLNAAGIKYTINRQMATLHGKLSGLEEVRLQLLQHSIKLPMTPTEGASQLTLHLVTKADVSKGFKGVQYFCKIGTIEYLSTVRLQVATEHPVLCQHEQVDLAKQLSREIDAPIEDLTLEQVSPDGGRSTQLVHTFLVPKDAKYLQTPPYYCTINTPAQGTIKVQLQHCGTRMSLQPPRRAISRIQDTMADMHDTLIGRHQALPSRSAKGQRLGVTDTSTIESIMRTQRVTIVDTYEGPGKTRVLIVQDQLAAVAIDAQVRTSEAHDLYEQLNLTNGMTSTPTNGNNHK